MYMTATENGHCQLLSPDVNMGGLSGTDVCSSHSLNSDYKRMAVRDCQQGLQLNSVNVEKLTELLLAAYRGLTISGVYSLLADQLNSATLGFSHTDPSCKLSWRS